MVFGYDYVEDCFSLGWCVCKPDFTACIDSCIFRNTCRGECFPPIENSSLTFSSCSSDPYGCPACLWGVCQPPWSPQIGCYCFLSGICEYTCDEGYYYENGECLEELVEEDILKSIFFAYVFNVGSHLLPIFAYFFSIILVLNLIRKHLTTF